MILKNLVKLLMVVSLVAPLWAGCIPVVYNPFTGQLDCAGNGVSPTANVTATAAGPVTSLAITITSLGLTVIDPSLIQCWSGTSTRTPIAITNYTTSGSNPITTVTPTFSSSSNVTCAVNASGATGPAGAAGATGPQGPPGAGAAPYTMCASGCNQTVPASGTTITAATHGQGKYSFIGQCLDGSGIAMNCGQTVNSSGDLTLSYTSPTPSQVAIDGATGGFPNPMTTAGDTIYGGASGVATRLAGAAGIYRSNGTTPSYAELSGDCTTSGSNAVTCTQINGANFTVNSSGLPTKIDGITTAGLGVPIIGWQSVLSNSSATSLVTLATAPGAGDYVITYSLDLHTACTTGSETVSLAFGWTGGAARTLTTGNWTVTNAQTAGSYLTGIQPIHVVSGNVTFTPAASGCATGTATWDGVVSLARIN
jgi:hypothetical protein